MKRRPYRLAERSVLEAAPPFSTQLVGKLLRDAQVGPKGRSTTHVEPSAEAVTFLTSILNMRHAYYFAAQEERTRKKLHDRAQTLIDELRGLMPAIVKHAEQQIIKNDIFSLGAFAATSALHEFLSSDTPIRALPQVTLPENIFGWQWCALSLCADVEALIGFNAAVRFIAAVVPSLSGENPKMATVQTWLKQQKR